MFQSCQNDGQHRNVVIFQLVFSRTVHGPSTLGLPNLGLVLDGTKCGDGHVCMARKCVPLSNLDPLNCPGTGDTICSGHGVCIVLLLEIFHCSSDHCAYILNTTINKTRIN